MAKQKRKIMRSLKIDEIAGVDKPAQAPAKSVIMKRAGEEPIVKAMFLTSSAYGHMHLLSDKPQDGGGFTSYETSLGAEWGHSHPYVVGEDGSLSVGDAEGHGHETLTQKSWVDLNFYDFPLTTDDPMLVTITTDGTGTTILPVQGGDDTEKSAGSSGGGHEPNVEDLPMTEAEKAAAEQELVAATKRADEAEAKLAKEIAYGALTDLQKAHYGTLDEAGQVSFLEMTPESRESALTKAQDDDAVVYTDVDGNEYRKSDDARLIASVKRGDAAIKAATMAQEKADNATLAKRADDDLGHLTGDTDVKVAALKAIDGIEDEGLRTKALEMLKSHDAGVTAAFEEHGTQKGQSITKAEDQLEVLAQKYAVDHKVNIVKARVAVLETDEGKTLYAETTKTPAAVA